LRVRVELSFVKIGKRMASTGRLRDSVYERDTFDFGSGRARMTAAWTIEHAQS
jgi:hypothetical protein